MRWDAPHTSGTVTVTVRRESDVRVVLGGEIDGAMERELAIAAGEAQRHGLPVVVDAGEVTFMDSSGVGLLARLAGPVRAVRVLNAPESVRFLLEVAGLDDLLDDR